MMDGQVKALRTGLDDAGFTDTAIMGYSASRHPRFMRHFETLLIPPRIGDRRTYQMPFTNAREAMREIETDIAEGVDIVMVKPAMPYLDLDMLLDRTRMFPYALIAFLESTR
jgi:porphobilinogen synthase